MAVTVSLLRITLTMIMTCMTMTLTAGMTGTTEEGKNSKNYIIRVKHDKAHIVGPWYGHFPLRAAFFYSPDGRLAPSDEDAFVVEKQYELC